MNVVVVVVASVQNLALMLDFNPTIEILKKILTIFLHDCCGMMMMITTIVVVVAAPSLLSLSLFLSLSLSHLGMFWDQNVTWE
jgi:hypothetical protein